MGWLHWSAAGSPPPCSTPRRAVRPAVTRRPARCGGARGRTSQLICDHALFNPKVEFRQGPLIAGLGGGDRAVGRARVFESIHA